MPDANTCLVLGVTGCVGLPLCETLIASGREVHGAARFRDHAIRAALESLGVALTPFDAYTDDPATLPDVHTVFLQVWDPKHLKDHESADREEVWELNFHAIGRVVRRYAGSASVIVNGSTCSIYGFGDRPPLGEDDTPYPDNDYAQARLAQERLIDFLCNPLGTRTCHLRYMRSNTVKRGTLRMMADAILEGRSLGDAPDARMQLIALSDFVRCTAMAVDAAAAPGNVVNIVHPEIRTARGFAHALHAAMGRGEVVFDCDTGGAERSITADASRMIDTFGPPQEDLDGLIRAVAQAVVNED